MEYGYFSHGEIVAPVPMMPRFGDIGAWHTLSDEDRAEHGWYPCVIIDPRKDQRLYLKLPAVSEFKEDHFEVTYAYIEKGIYQVMEERLEVLQSAYESALDKPVIYKDRPYFVKHLPEFKEAVESGEEVVYVHTGLTSKWEASDARELVALLINYKQKCLGVRYEVQEQIKNSKTPEDVIKVDILKGFDKTE